ncbi:hypothetical protein Purlil1_2442 [Purpureocillium lilacinum]|uniref:Uncharacterized protein n=1 Tax=Purpureocillium lilacinum TaxID=33203 RepID=A0ABR0CAM2_PURLI|nr:hypothetical protein Purlil1_2442 [Purpureocillium lilacinum]
MKSRRAAMVAAVVAGVLRFGRVLLMQGSDLVDLGLFVFIAVAKHPTTCPGAFASAASVGHIDKVTGVSRGFVRADKNMGQPASGKGITASPGNFFSLETVRDPRKTLERNNNGGQFNVAT